MPADLDGRRGEGGHGDVSEAHWAAKRNFGWARRGRICVKHPISALILAKNGEICVEWAFLHSYGREIPGQARNDENEPGMTLLAQVSYDLGAGP